MNTSGMDRYYLFSQFHQAFFDQDYFNKHGNERISHVTYIERTNSKADNILEEVCHLCFNTGICKDGIFTFNDLISLDPVTFRFIRDKYLVSLQNEVNTMDNLKTELERLKQKR